MSDPTTRFPVGIVTQSSSASPVGAERVVVAHARALVRAGYPVRLVTGSMLDASSEYVVRAVPELSSAHPRIAAINEALTCGSVPDDYETCVQDLAQAIGRELVGCGSVFVHDLLTIPANLAAAEAIRRLAQGSRGIVAHGAPTRRWIIFCHHAPLLPVARAARDTRDGLWKLLARRLPGGRYAAPSATRKKELARALRMRTSEIRVVPDGVDVSGFLELTPQVGAFARENRLLEADLVMLTPSRVLERKALARGIQITKALSKARRGIIVRWLVTAPSDPEHPASKRTLDRLIIERERLGLRDALRFLSSEAEWARPRVRAEDLRALYRLADCLLLPSEDENFGPAALEGALARQVLVFGPAPALGELAMQKGEAIRLGRGESAAAAAKRILRAIEASPGWRLRRRTLRELDWDEIARRHLVPLIEGPRDT